MADTTSKSGSAAIAWLAIFLAIALGAGGWYLQNQQSASIGALATEVLALKKASSNTGARDQIKSVAGQVKSLSGRVGSVSGQLKSLSGRVGSVSGQVKSLSGRVGSVSGRVGSVSGQVKSLSGSVDAVSSSVKTLQASIKSLQEKVNKVEQDAGKSRSMSMSDTKDIKASVAKANAALGNITKTLGNLANRVKKLEAN